jgi:hypothetical protein
MLNKILSRGDFKKLKIGDQLLNSPEPRKAKIYIIKNISREVVYAIYDDGQLELKLLDENKIVKGSWWVSGNP